MELNNGSLMLTRENASSLNYYNDNSIITNTWFKFNYITDYIEWNNIIVNETTTYRFYIQYSFGNWRINTPKNSNMYINNNYHEVTLPYGQGPNVIQTYSINKTLNEGSNIIKIVNNTGYWWFINLTIIKPY